MVIIAFLIKINRKLLITTLSHYNFHRCWVQTLLKRNPASARCTLGKVMDGMLTAPMDAGIQILVLQKWS